MNTDNAAGLPPLPELSDARIDEIEDALFAGIARERVLEQGAQRREADKRSAANKRSRRRRTVWWTTAAAAVVVVAAVAIGPTLGNLGVVSGAGSAVDKSAPVLGGPVPQSDGDAGHGFVGADTGKAGDAASGQAGSSIADREIIATAQATVRVDDVATAAQAIGAAADERGGYVESMNVGQNGDVAQSEGVSGDTTMPYPVASGAWVTVRVPADELTGAIDELSALGTVESSSITRQDVTEQAVDLRARIGALEASVSRLTELMGKAGSIGDLITAESALSERQAELESYQQQLKSLESQVSLSSLTVSLAATTEVVKADPAGFGDGLATGWNGLVATLNGLVVAIGFLLPWLVVAAVAALVVWGVLRLRRRRRAASSEAIRQDADGTP